MKMGWAYEHVESCVGLAEWRLKRPSSQDVCKAGLELQSCWNPGALENRLPLFLHFSPSSSPPPFEHCSFRNQLFVLYSSRLWARHDCTQVTHLALSGLAMPHDHSAVASAIPGQQLLSVSEFIVPGDEPIDSSILDEPGHRTFVFGSSA